MPSPKITMACSGLVAYIDPPKGYRVVEAYLTDGDGSRKVNWVRLSFEKVME
jgi:hypothetical protein